MNNSQCELIVRTIAAGFRAVVLAIAASQLGTAGSSYVYKQVLDSMKEEPGIGNNDVEMGIRNLPSD